MVKSVRQRATLTNGTRLLFCGKLFVKQEVFKLYCVFHKGGKFIYQLSLLVLNVLCYGVMSHFLSSSNLSIYSCSVLFIEAINSSAVCLIFSRVGPVSSSSVLRVIL